MPLCRYLSPMASDKGEEEDDECQQFKCPSDLSLIESTTSGFVKVHARTQLFGTRAPPNIEHELNVAKSIMQQGSTTTGDNLFDHLANIIKHVISDRPANIVDYFEEFSFNLREQKLRIPERFPWFHYKPPNTEEARAFFNLMKIPIEAADIEYDVCEAETPPRPSASIVSSEECVDRELLPNENIMQLQLYWALCGFGFLPDEVLYLAYWVQKIQHQPNVEHARFWGKIYGIKKPYYIVEVSLNQCELEVRLEQMREEMIEKMTFFRCCSDSNMSPEIQMDLTPGSHWQDQPEADLQRMQPAAEPIPKTKTGIQFDIPPEAIGTGLNRRTYFVANSLFDEWIELPIVTPKQIQVSKKIKKFLTGDLDANIISYPSFPGVEKHYLRAIIARITSGTYIAPFDYYRRLTKRERMDAMGQEPSDFGEEAEEEEFDGEEEEEELHNDDMITENGLYLPTPRRLMNPKSWVHVRPSILDQGRVVYFDEQEARRALQREAMLRSKVDEELDYECLEEMEEEQENEKDIIEEDDRPGPESGPLLFTHCNEDSNNEHVEPWTLRYSSNHNYINRLVMARSNLWPGAYSYTFDKYADSIYMGWGVKYTARNITVPQVPPIQDDYAPDIFEEMRDPTVEMEEKWRLWQRKKFQSHEEHMGEEDIEEEDSC